MKSNITHQNIDSVTKNVSVRTGTCTYPIRRAFTRYQIYGITKPDPQTVARRHLPKPEELTFFETLSGLVESLSWSFWERAGVKGFRAITSSQIEIEIRLIGPCLYGNGNRRWSCYGIVPTRDKHWYYIKCRDHLKLSGKKDLIDFAAVPSSAGYEQLKKLHDALMAKENLSGENLSINTLTVLERSVRACA